MPAPLGRTDVENFRLVAVTNPPRDGEGHVHAYVDETEQRGPKLEFVFANITAGTHKVRGELHLSNHSALEPPVMTEISVTTVASTSGSTNNTNTSGTSGSSASGTEAVTVKEFSLEADDNGFYLDSQKISSISVSTGDKVRITFTVRMTSVSFGGLEFRSVVRDSGTIRPGESTNLEFTASSDVAVSSYWPRSNVRKATLNITVS